MTVGARVRQLRQSRQWSQSHVERMAGLTLTALSRIESNKRPLTFAQAMRLAEIFEVSLGVLAGWEQETPTIDPPTRVLVANCLRHSRRAQRMVNALVQDLQDLRVRE
jgi:transcriptional regulator with XRE-family HTH domain